MGKMCSQNFYSTITSLTVYYLMIPLTLSSQLSIANQGDNVGVSELLDFIKTEFGKQNHRIALLEVKNGNQDEDIDLLKMDNLKIHDKIDLIDELGPLNEIISNNDAEPSNSYHENASDALIKKQYQKRASRLIPINLLFNKEIEIVPKVPFNCSDLNKMGYTVNGIYLVKGGNTNNGNSRIIVVLYDFQPPVAKKGSSLPAVEELLGFVDLQFSNSAAASEGIYFYVQRGKGPTFKDGILRFHKEILNIGKGMNISIGVFTAPKAGIYQFSFAISKEGFSLPNFYIYLRVNKVKKGMAIISSGLITTPATFQSAFKLKKGNQVDIWKPNIGTIGECIVLGGDTAEPPCHHFTGWLLKKYI